MQVRPLSGRKGAGARCAPAPCGLWLHWPAVSLIVEAVSVSRPTRSARFYLGEPAAVDGDRAAASGARLPRETHTIRTNPGGTPYRWGYTFSVWWSSDLGLSFSVAQKVYQNYAGSNWRPPRYKDVLSTSTLSKHSSESESDHSRIAVQVPQGL